MVFRWKRWETENGLERGFVKHGLNAVQITGPKWLPIYACIKKLFWKIQSLVCYSVPDRYQFPTTWKITLIKKK